MRTTLKLRIYLTVITVGALLGIFGLNASARGSLIGVAATGNANTTLLHTGVAGNATVTERGNGAAIASAISSKIAAISTDIKLKILPVLKVRNATVGTAAAFSSCQTNFTVAFIHNLSASAPSFASLTTMGQQLSQDNAQLSTYASEGNLTQYNTYLHGTFDAQLSSINTDIKKGLKNSSITANQLAALRAQYNRSISYFRNCSSTFSKQFADDVIAGYNNSINMYNNESLTLSTKQGIDDAPLLNLTSQAQVAVIAPLAAGISSATNASQLRSVLASYCLFDGCKSGYNFHLDAKYQLEKLELATSYAENQTGNATLYSEIWSHLDNASAQISAAGTATYSNGQSNKIWNNLTRAQDELAKGLKLGANASKVLARYQADISHDQNLTAKMAAKGVNTSALTALLNNATVSVVDKLQAEQNATGVAKYCLYDGCAAGLDFHLAARFSTGSLQAILAKVEGMTNVTVNQTAVTAINSHLANATNELHVVGYTKYQDNQSSIIWSNITAAQHLMLRLTK